VEEYVEIENWHYRVVTSMLEEDGLDLLEDVLHNQH
jgi:hypothetical protein